jgi:hypothetical protein
MCRRATQRWSAGTGVAPAARRLVESRCLAWELTPIAGDAQLIMSELVTNAVLHAGTAIAVSLDVAAGFLHLAVEDAHPLHPSALPSRTDLLADIDSIAALADHRDAADSDLRHASLHAGPSRSVAAGRGLLIVSGLADDWGTTSVSPQSKAVWARLAVHEQWAFLDECTCPSATGLTASGSPVVHIAGPWDATPG